MYLGDFDSPDRLASPLDPILKVVYALAWSSGLFRRDCLALPLVLCREGDVPYHAGIGSASYQPGDHSASQKVHVMRIVIACPQSTRLVVVEKVGVVPVVGIEAEGLERSEKIAG